MRVALLTSSAQSRDAVAEILEARGHEALRYADAEPALAILRENRDVGGLLVVAPDNHEASLETIWNARLCASAERPLYIGLLTQPLSPDKTAEALDCGADDVLGLPLSPDVIYARLRSAERLNQLQLKLVELATRDGLTHLYNRQAFFRGVDRLTRNGAPPHAAIMIDVDHFKSVNDNYGHAAGDAALKSVAKILADACIHAARLGGEEFVVLPAPCVEAKTCANGRSCADASSCADAKASAMALAETLREKIFAQDIVCDGVRFKVSCSFGVAVAEPGGAIDDLLRRADAALYAAKHAGRNRVMLFNPNAHNPTAEHESSVIRRSAGRPPPSRRHAKS